MLVADAWNIKIVQGALYETGCAYPLEAIWNTTCPEARSLTATSTMGGDPQVGASALQTLLCRLLVCLSGSQTSR